jgi:hypothetical protein
MLSALPPFTREIEVAKTGMSPLNTWVLRNNMEQPWQEFPKGTFYSG